MKKQRKLYISPDAEIELFKISSSIRTFDNSGLGWEEEEEYSLRRSKEISWE